MPGAAGGHHEARRQPGVDQRLADIHTARRLYARQYPPGEFSELDITEAKFRAGSGQTGSEIA